MHYLRRFFTHLPRGLTTCLSAEPSSPLALATKVLWELRHAVHFCVVHGCFPPQGHCDRDPMARKIKRGPSERKSSEPCPTRSGVGPGVPSTFLQWQRDVVGHIIF